MCILSRIPPTPSRPDRPPPARRREPRRQLEGVLPSELKIAVVSWCGHQGGGLLGLPQHGEFRMKYNECLSNSWVLVSNSSRRDFGGFVEAESRAEGENEEHPMFSRMYAITVSMPLPLCATAP